MKLIIICCFLMVSLWVIFECTPSKESSQNEMHPENKEARDDSMQLASAYHLQSQIQIIFSPKAETVPVQEDPTEDAADDPAIWYNSGNPDNSQIFGTNKKSGVYSYDVTGNEVTFYPFGKVNNIDIRQGIIMGKDTLDVLGGSNRTDNSLILYRISKEGKLINLLDENYTIDTLDIDEVYGFCLYKNRFNEVFALVNGKNGKINQYKLVSEAQGTYHLIRTNSWQLNSQPEGMVADDELANLYIGEEENGIWKLSLSEPNKSPIIIEFSKAVKNPNIAYDIEGLSIYYGKNGSGFLMASIQGNFSYAVFDRKSNVYLGSFIIKDSDNIDGVEETDGLDIYSHNFGSSFPNGILVVQDGYNFDEGIMVGQNFKYLDLDQIKRQFMDLNDDSDL